MLQVKKVYTILKKFHTLNGVTLNICLYLNEKVFLVYLKLIK